MPTKLKLSQIDPPPMSATQTTAALNSKANSSDLNNYLPLSGGTLTGKVTINKDSGTSPSDGSLTITGGKQNYAIQIQTNGVTKGTAPSEVLNNGIEFYGNTMTSYKNRLGNLEQHVSTENVSTMGMYAYSCTAAETTKYCEISCNVDASGGVFTKAPTPATSDNSTQIATTAFVKAQNYITSSSNITGNSATSTKLATARNISVGNLDFTGSANFDGSDNITLNATPYYATITVGNTNNYPYHYIGTTGIVTGNYIDKVINLLVTRDYLDGGSGIVRIEFRTNNASGGATGSCSVRWLCRDNNLPVDCIQVGFRNTAADSIADIFYKSAGTYNSAVVRVLSSGSRGNINRAFTLVNSSEVNNTTTSNKLTSVGAYKAIADAVADLHSGKTYTSTITASDNAVVQYANTVTGYTVEIVSAKSIETTNGYIAYNSGLQICYGQMWGVASGTTITYPRAFSKEPRVVVSRHYGATSISSAGDEFVWVYSTGTTGFKVGSNDNAIYGFYIAIGVK